MLKRKLDTIEKMVDAFNGADAALIRMRYFDCTEIAVMARQLHISVRAIYKRLDRIISEMEYCLTGTV